MDKVVSTRLDEAVVRIIGLLARRLGTSKKAIIEQAVRRLARELEQAEELDILAMTSGAWQRDEPADETTARSRRAFRDGLERHHR